VTAGTAAAHPHATSNRRATERKQTPRSGRLVGLQGDRIPVRKSAAPLPGAVREVRIGEDGGRAALLVDGVVQSISPADGLIDGGYWAAMVPDERTHRALILGLGGGTLTRLLQARWGDLHMVGVDNDATILDTANAVGWLPRCGLEIVMADAFEYVHECRERFDYIAVDLFRGERLAGRAFGKPFLRRLRELLEPHGRLAVNMFSDHRAPYRVERLAAFFDIREQVGVGGNVIVHARRRRA
jgi:spermidine synthase